MVITFNLTYDKYLSLLCLMDTSPMRGTTGNVYVRSLWERLLPVSLNIIILNVFLKYIVSDLALGLVTSCMLLAGVRVHEHW